MQQTCRRSAERNFPQKNGTYRFGSRRLAWKSSCSTYFRRESSTSCWRIMSMFDQYSLMVSSLGVSSPFSFANSAQAERRQNKVFFCPHHLIGRLKKTFSENACRSYDVDLPIWKRVCSSKRVIRNSIRTPYLSDGKTCGASAQAGWLAAIKQHKFLRDPLSDSKSRFCTQPFPESSTWRSNHRGCRPMCATLTTKRFSRVQTERWFASLSLIIYQTITSPLVRRNAKPSKLIIFNAT